MNDNEVKVWYEDDGPGNIDVAMGVTQFNDIKIVCVKPNPSIGSGYSNRVGDKIKVIRAVWQI